VGAGPPPLGGRGPAPGGRAFVRCKRTCGRLSVNAGSFPTCDHSFWTHYIYIYKYAYRPVYIYTRTHCMFVLTATFESDLKPVIREVPKLIIARPQVSVPLTFQPVGCYRVGGTTPTEESGISIFVLHFSRK
jgi:hypothetical protein